MRCVILAACLVLGCSAAGTQQLEEDQYLVRYEVGTFTDSVTFAILDTSLNEVVRTIPGPHLADSPFVYEELRVNKSAPLMLRVEGSMEGPRSWGRIFVNGEQKHFIVTDRSDVMAAFEWIEERPIEEIRYSFSSESPVIERVSFAVFEEGEKKNITLQAGDSALHIEEGASVPNNFIASIGGVTRSGYSHAGCADSVIERMVNGRFFIVARSRDCEFIHSAGVAYRLDANVGYR